MNEQQAQGEEGGVTIAAGRPFEDFDLVVDAFDALKADDGYAAAIESSPDHLLASHGIRPTCKKVKGLQLEFPRLRGRTVVCGQAPCVDWSCPVLAGT